MTEARNGPFSSSAARWAAGIAVCVAILQTAAGAHTEAPADFRTLVADAETIARGHVTDVHGAALPSGEIVSIATVEVDETLKGRADRFVSLILPGGQIGRIRTVVPGAPRVHVNDAAVFLLRRGPDNVWRLATLTAGLYRLRREPDTGRVVIDPPPVIGRTSGAGAIDRGSLLRRPLSVPEFEALVRLVAQAHVQPIRSNRR